MCSEKERVLKYLQLFWKLKDKAELRSSGFRTIKRESHFSLSPGYSYIFEIEELRHIIRLKWRILLISLEFQARQSFAEGNLQSILVIQEVYSLLYCSERFPMFLLVTFFMELYYKSDYRTDSDSETFNDFSYLFRLILSWVKERD